MNDIKRYTPDWNYTGTAFQPTTRECTNGEYVRYEDYAKLKAEVERLTWASQGSVKYVDHTMALTRQSMEHHKQVSRLEAQVERLTKAGDELSWAYHALFRNTLCDGWYRRFMSLQECKVKEVEAWNAAKEGKQQP